MRVLLINPAGYETKYKKQKLINYTAIPLGLAYIAAVLEKAGHKPIVLDAAVHQMDRKTVEYFIKKSRPDVAALAAFTPTFNYAADHANIIKENFPNVPVIIGGHHVTFLPERSLRAAQSIDYVIRGEGDYTTTRLVNCLDGDGTDIKEINGISYRNNGGIKHNPDAPLIKNLDEIPFPARKYFPNQHYHFFGSSLKGTSMVSSRGCNRLCSFCSITQFYNHRWRARSPLNVIKEMLHVKENYGSTIIGFMDDCFALNKKRLFNLCNKMIEYGVVDNICWGSALRVDTLNYEILNQMRKAGCAMLFYGVESGNQIVLNNVQKGTTVEMIEDAFKWSRRLGIDTIASLALGLPGDTFDDCLKTIEWVKNKLKPTFVVWAAATPYPGTPFYQECLEKGWLKEIPDDWSSYTMIDPVLDLTNMTKEDLKNLIKYAYKSMHLNAFYLLNRLIYEIRQGMELYGTLNVFKQIIQTFLPWLWHIKKYGTYSQLQPKNLEEWKN
ncbi:MAG: radical SAM protein [Promethearchaeota archaeon]|nr:MAG: radical SAM protein [Candidatus Lokiarchaeota archaeon]